MKLNKVIIPLAVVTAMTLTTETTQAKDWSAKKTVDLIEAVVFGSDRKGPPKKKNVVPSKKYSSKKKPAAKKQYSKKPAPPKKGRHGERRSDRRH